MADDKKIETPAETPEAPAAAAAVADGELTSPPQMRRPDRTKVKDQEDAIRAVTSAIEEKIRAVIDKAKALQQANSGAGDASAELRSKLKALKVKREQLIAQRMAIYSVRDAARESRDAKMSEMKELKSQTKFKDTADIDKMLKKLETQQSTTSMTLAKEKEVLKEIDDLKKQRRVLAQAMAVTSELDGGKTASVDHGASIKDINEQLTAIKAEMDGVSGELNKMFDSKKDSAYPALMQEKAKLMTEKKAKQEEGQALWDAFKKANEEWRANQELWDAYKKAKAVKDNADYEARKAEAAARRAEELAKKTPYEEEMDLCEYLANYLTTTFVKEAKAAEEAKTVLTEFDGLALAPSKKNGGDFYMAPSGKKGPKKKGGADKKKNAKIVLHTDTLESFGLLKLDPPLTVEQVPAVIEGLKAKKAEFKAMPRGQVVSIAEMNQKFEAEAEAGRKPRDPKPDAKKGAAKGASKKIDVNSAELFPALGGAKPAAAAKE